MGSLAKGWRIQTRVIGALMIRELTTRFGRENIGFLWMMVEPLLFAVLVGIMWTFMNGPTKHGVGVMAFVVTGYIPLVLFRGSVSRSIGLFKANMSLMYHRQIKILDFILVRFLIEWIGHMMAYVFVMLLLMLMGLFPVPVDLGLLMLGWLYYSLFTLSLCFILAPTSEFSEVLEKFMPVTTYLMIPFSGTFYMVDWLTPEARNAVLYFPPVHAMEMMRFGIFGHHMLPHFDYFYPVAVSAALAAFGLLLCRRVRRHLVVE